jgi:hypothetical protein
MEGKKWVRKSDNLSFLKSEGINKNREYWKNHGIAPFLFLMIITMILLIIIIYIFVL